MLDVTKIGLGLKKEIVILAPWGELFSISSPVQTRTRHTTILLLVSTYLPNPFRQKKGDKKT